MILYSSLVLVFLLKATWAQVFDLTRQPDASGPEVVEAVTDILGRSCVFPDDLLYLRRVAYVESHDGENLNATNFDGGIWRVDEATFNQTRYDPNLAQWRDAIQRNLFISWNSVTWSQLRMPLFSAIAAELAAILKAGSGNIPNTVETQAAFWGGSAKANIYVRRVEELNKRRTYIHDVDVVFLLDSSASLSPSDFEKAKEFTEKVLEGFDVDSGKVRVGVVAYSTVVYPRLRLDNGLSQLALLRAVANISYTPGGTHTHEALLYALNEITQAQKGARENSVKIVILVTDGRSDDRVATVQNAEQLKAAGVNIFTVGVGDSVDKNELTRVASSPPCVHVKTVSNYTDLPAINFEIQRQSLKSSLILKPGDYNFSCNSEVDTLILPSSAGNTTVEITSDSGSVLVYGAASNAFSPSSVLYSFKDSAESGIPVQIFVRDGSQIGLAFKNSTSGGCQSGFMVKVITGDRISIGTRVTCVSAGITSPCTATDFDGSPFVITGILDPSFPNICKNKDLFRAPYPNKPDRYLYCSSGNMIVIFCPLGMHFDLKSSSCQRGVIVTTRPPTMPIVNSFAIGQFTTASTTTVGHPTTPTGTRIPIPPLLNPCTTTAIANEQFIFPYLPDNTAYIKCGVFPNTGAVLFCPPHRFYDDLSKSCLYHEVIVNATQEVFTSFKNPCDRNHAGDVEYHPHPTNPHKFIQCDAFGEAYEKDCFKPDEVWRQDVLSCVNAGINFNMNGVGK